MPTSVPGITKNALWKSWKAIRRDLRHGAVRDVVDFLDFDIDPDVWINRLRRQIADGSYEPKSPVRFTLAKSKGLSRRMTTPSIPDLVLYRAIVDFIFRKARRRQHKHVYFSQARLAQVSGAAMASAKAQMSYGSLSQRRFLAWLRYDQYRKLLILRRVYRFFVITDIANFFDTILYGRVTDAFHDIRVPARMVGLLFFLLERLSPRDAYSESPRIGLPVDEFDCSRNLAHMVLFPHDDRIVAHVGEDAYVRWMDDQTIGVAARAEGLKVVAMVQESLARLHLTPNTAKTRLLSLAEARRHFHLDLNALLDAADKMPSGTASERRALAKAVRSAWNRAKAFEGQGEWEKVLKRLYRLAGLARTRAMRRRAIADVIRYPTLARRITAYMRCTGSGREYVTFARALWLHPEQIYPDVNVFAVEEMLRLEPVASEQTDMRRVAAGILAGTLKIPGADQARGIAPLLLLRFGDRRSLPLLKKHIESKPSDVAGPVIRAAGAIYASYGWTDLQVVRRAAGRLWKNHLAEVVRLVEAMAAWDEVPKRLGARLKLDYDAVTGQRFIDTRKLLAARLLALRPKPRVRAWLGALRSNWIAGVGSSYEKALVRRLLRV
jgi:hypothetical protein